MKLFVFPGVIDDEIVKIGAQQIPYMRTAAFSALVKESEQLLLQLVGCKSGKVIVYTASGTAAMDGMVSSYVATKKRVLAIAGGSFGYRWKNLCDYYHVNCELFEVPFAQDINYPLLEQKIHEIKPEILLCQHHETSSGQLFDVKHIGVLCKKSGTVFIVDAISSFLADPYNMDEFGIDATILSSQKGLNIPPGLSFVILSEKLLQEQFAHKNYYLEFNENLRNLQRGQTPYSPATTLFLQLHTRLKMLEQTGTELLLEQIRKNALVFRKKCKEYGWETPVQQASNCITGFYVKTDGYRIFNELLKENIYIMPGGINNYLRVSHLGCQNEEDHLLLAQRIKELDR